MGTSHEPLQGVVWAHATSQVRLHLLPCAHAIREMGEIGGIARAPTEVAQAACLWVPAQKTNPLLKLVGMDPFHLPPAASHGRLARKDASPHPPLLGRAARKPMFLFEPMRQREEFADPNANLGRGLGDCQ